MKSMTSLECGLAVLRGGIPDRVSVTLHNFQMSDMRDITIMKRPKLSWQVLWVSGRQVVMSLAAASAGVDRLSRWMALGHSVHANRSHGFTDKSVG